MTIAAIGALALVAIPGFANTQLRSAFAVCMGNQRQLIQSVHSFAQDNQDVLVPNSYRGPDGVSISLVGGGFWAGADGIKVGMTAEEALKTVQDGFRKGPLWPYLKSTESVHCPGDERMSLRRVGSGWGYDSYSKSETIGKTSGFDLRRGFERIAEVSDPSMSFVFCEEADPRNYNLGTWVLGTSNPGWINAFGLFHDNGTMFAFLDGNVGLHRWRDARTLRASTDSMKGIASFSWAGGGARNPDFRWVWDRYLHPDWKPLQ